MHGNGGTSDLLRKAKMWRKEGWRRGESAGLSCAYRQKSGRGGLDDEEIKKYSFENSE